jgi:hypothetical protein
LPFIRAFTSIVGGLVRIPALRFGLLSAIGTVIYATALSLIGYGLGSAWQRISHGLSELGYALFALVVVAFVAFVVYRWRRFRRETAGANTGSANAGAANTRAANASGAHAARHRASAPAADQRDADAEVR